MRREHDALAASSMVGVVLAPHDKGFVVQKQQEVCPFLEERCDLLTELHFPMVEGTGLVRQLLLALFGVGDNHHMLAGGDDGVAGCEELAPLFSEVGVTFAVTEGLDAGPLVLLADMGDTEQFSPIRRVDDQHLADVRCGGDLVHNGDKLVPRLRLVYAADVHLGGAAFSVGLGNRLAKVLFPMPSLPYTTVLTVRSILPLEILSMMLLLTSNW